MDYGVHHREAARHASGNGDTVAHKAEHTRLAEQGGC